MQSQTNHSDNNTMPQDTTPTTLTPTKPALNIHSFAVVLMLMFIFAFAFVLGFDYFFQRSGLQGTAISTVSSLNTLFKYWV